MRSRKIGRKAGTVAGPSRGTSGSIGVEHVLDRRPADGGDPGADERLVRRGRGGDEDALRELVDAKRQGRALVAGLRHGELVAVATLAAQEADDAHEARRPPPRRRSSRRGRSRRHRAPRRILRGRYRGRPPDGPCRATARAVRGRRQTGSALLGGSLTGAEVGWRAASVSSVSVGEELVGPAASEHDEQRRAAAAGRAPHRERYACAFARHTAAGPVVRGCRSAARRVRCRLAAGASTDRCCPTQAPEAPDIRGITTTHGPGADPRRARGARQGQQAATPRRHRARHRLRQGRALDPGPGRRQGLRDAVSQRGPHLGRPTCASRKRADHERHHQERPAQPAQR